MIADKRILLVDDDKSIRTSLAYFFRKKTRTFKAVASTEEAERVLTQDREWDVVISDYKLPGMDGIAFLKRLRANQSRVLVALITAYANLDIDTEALRAGIHDFIQKPLKAAMISDAIERMLAKSAECGEATVQFTDNTDEEKKRKLAGRSGIYHPKGDPPDEQYVYGLARKSRIRIAQNAPYG